MKKKLKKHGKKNMKKHENHGNKKTYMFFGSFRLSWIKRTRTMAKVTQEEPWLFVATMAGCLGSLLFVSFETLTKHVEIVLKSVGVPVGRSSTNINKQSTTAVSNIFTCVKTFSKSEPDGMPREICPQWTENHRPRICHII